MSLTVTPARMMPSLRIRHSKHTSCSSMSHPTVPSQKCLSALRFGIYRLSPHRTTGICAPDSRTHHKSPVPMERVRNREPTYVSAVRRRWRGSHPRSVESEPRPFHHVLGLAPSFSGYPPRVGTLGSERSGGVVRKRNIRPPAPKPELLEMPSD